MIRQVALILLVVGIVQADFFDRRQGRGVLQDRQGGFRERNMIREEFDRRAPGDFCESFIDCYTGEVCTTNNECVKV